METPLSRSSANKRRMRRGKAPAHLCPRDEALEKQFKAIGLAPVYRPTGLLIPGEVRTDYRLDIVSGKPVITACVFRVQQNHIAQWKTAISSMFKCQPTKSEQFVQFNPPGASVLFSENGTIEVQAAEHSAEWIICNYPVLLTNVKQPNSIPSSTKAQAVLSPTESIELISTPVPNSVARSLNFSASKSAPEHTFLPTVTPSAEKQSTPFKVVANGISQFFRYTSAIISRKTPENSVTIVPSVMSTSNTSPDATVVTTRSPAMNNAVTQTSSDQNTQTSDVRFDEINEPIVQPTPPESSLHLDLSDSTHPGNVEGTIPEVEGGDPIYFKRWMESGDKKYQMLSNLWPHKIWYNNQEFNSVVNAYQYEFAMHHGQHFIAEEILKKSTTPEHANALASGIKNILPSWHAIKFHKLYDINKCRASQHPDYEALILSTSGRELKEDSIHSYWGCKGKKPKGKMGLLLMQLREELQLKQYRNMQNATLNVHAASFRPAPPTRPPPPTYDEVDQHRTAPSRPPAPTTTPADTPSTTTADPSYRHVYILGESMTHGIHPKLPKEYIVHTISRSGATLAELTTLVPHALSSNASHVALMGGTNDSHLNPDMFAHAYDSLVKAVKSQCPNAQITCCGLFDRKDKSVTGKLQELNTRIMCTSHQYINNIENSDNMDVHTSAGLHLNQKGQVHFSEAVKKCILQPDVEVVYTFNKTAPGQHKPPPRTRPKPRVHPGPPAPPTWWENSVPTHHQVRRETSSANQPPPRRETRQSHRETAPTNRDTRQSRWETARPRRDTRSSRWETARPRHGTRQSHQGAAPPHHDVRQSQWEAVPPRHDARQSHWEADPPRHDARQSHWEAAPPRRGTRQSHQGAAPPHHDARQSQWETAPTRHDARQSHWEAAPPRHDASQSHWEAAPQPLQPPGYSPWMMYPPIAPPMMQPAIPMQQYTAYPRYNMYPMCF